MSYINKRENLWVVRVRLLREKRPKAGSGSEYYIGVVPTGQIEVGRRGAVAAQEPSLADMDRRETQEVGVRTNME
jgi:hypothetical protein